MILKLTLENQEVGLSGALILMIIGVAVPNSGLVVVVVLLLGRVVVVGLEVVGLVVVGFVPGTTIIFLVLLIFHLNIWEESSILANIGIIIILE
jgi:hypothetical protein